MIDEQELKNFFIENRTEIPDNDFSKQVQNHLPARNSMLSQIISPICTIIGLFLMISIVGFSTIQTQLLSLINAVAHLQIPSVDSIMTYFGLLAALIYIGFSTVETDFS